MNLFSVAFLKTALEHALVVGLSTLAASPILTSGGLTLKGIEAAAIAAGVGALYAFVRQLGAVQSANSVTKVDTPAK